MQVNVLAAYLYIHDSDQMPDEILNDDGTVNIKATNQSFEEWYFQPTHIQNFDTDRVQRFLDSLSVLCQELIQVDQNQEDLGQKYMSIFYDQAKEVFDHDKSQIRTYFKWIYLICFQNPNGPRLGEFVSIYGAQEFQYFLERKLREI